MLKIFTSLFTKSEPEPAVVAQVSSAEPVFSRTDSKQHRFKLEDVPRYPPYNPGIPAVDPDQILDSQQELLDKLKRLLAIPQADFDRLYLSTIRNYASFVHLLPASESHHHRGTGGLFRHGLEAGLYGAAHADRMLFVLDEPPSRRRVLEPLWRLGGFIASMSHDIGKPVSDMEITDTDGLQVWNPFAYPLHKWAIKRNLDYYHLRFRPNRHKDHETIGLLVLDMIIDQDVREALSEAGPAVLKNLIDSVSNIQNASGANVFRDLVIRADRDSVERDLRVNGGMQSSMPSVGIAAERTVMDVMRRLIRNKQWKVNRKGARIWQIDGNLYVAWSAARDIVRVMDEDKVPGVPRDPDSIADMLIDRELAVPRETFSGRSRYWQIAPELMGGASIKVLRIASPDLLIDPAPGNVAGRVILDESADSNVNPVVIDSVVKAEKPVQEAPQQKVEAAQESVVAPVKQKKSNDQVIHPAPVAVAPTVTVSIPFRGIVKELFTTLAEEIASGSRNADEVLHEGNLVLLLWPQAFTGFGIAPKDFLKEINDGNFAEPNPDAPARFIRESLNGSKVVALRPEAGKALLAMIEQAKSSEHDVDSVEETARTQKRPPSDDEILLAFAAFYRTTHSPDGFQIVRAKDGWLSMPFTAASNFFARAKKMPLTTIKEALTRSSDRGGEGLRIVEGHKGQTRIEIDAGENP